MLKKANNIIRIPTSLDGKFFRHWLEFLRPFHTLSNRDMDIAACFLKHRYLLSKVIKDESILDTVSLNEDTRKKVKADCNLNNSHFQVIMSKLKKSNFIIDNRINPKFIPNISSDEDPNYFQLLLLFDLK